MRPEEAHTVLDALARAGFDTHEEYPHWLYKAFKDDVLVDIIFRSTRDILMDEEMIGRAVVLDFRGRPLPIAPPEDVLIMKAIASGEDTPRYWYDALAIIANTASWTGTTSCGARASTARDGSSACCCTRSRTTRSSRRGRSRGCSRRSGAISG